MSGIEIIKFKTDSEIIASPFCLENISDDWSTDNLKKKKKKKKKKNRIYWLCL